jgi:hypothetical protein
MSKAVKTETSAKSRSVNRTTMAIGVGVDEDLEFIV